MLPSKMFVKHGITTVQDTGGYSLNIFGGGYEKVGLSVNSPAEAEKAVNTLVDGGETGTP
jgi:hypothetical protein